jgi:hypothetical protein
MNHMYKTVIFVTVGGIIAIGLVGGIILALYRPDASAAFATLLTLLLSP